MNKFLLAVDGYTLQGSEGFEMNTYLIKDGEFLPLKEQNEAVYMNLDNYVGGGEAMDYDLFMFPEELNVVFVHQKKEGKEHKIRAAFENGKIDKAEVTALIAKKFAIPETDISITMEDLGSTYTLEELAAKIPSNDLAQRDIGTAEERKRTLEYLEEEMEKRNHQTSTYPKTR